MALKQGIDYVMNIDEPNENEFLKLANNHNVGHLFLGTKNYFFAIEVFDFKATFETKYNYSQGNTFFVQTNHYFTNNVAGKTVPQALMNILTNDESKLRDLEGFLSELMVERAEEPIMDGIKGEKINIQEAEKFRIKKLWIGGGTVNYKLRGDKFQKQIPIVKAADARKLKAFYHGD